MQMSQLIPPNRGSEPTINVPPVPHIPPATDVPVVGDVSSSKFDLPTPQPVPQFVPLEPPSFGTLQFGAVATTTTAPTLYPFARRKIVVERKREEGDRPRRDRSIL